MIANREGRGGLTLIEMLVAITVLAIFMAFVFTNILNTRRVSSLEDIRLDMDRAANGALREISSLVKDAVLPIRASGKGRFATILNSNDSGFGSIADGWEEALGAGRNYFPFCVPVDADETGDHLDGNLVPYLGMVRRSGAVTTAEYDNDFTLNGSINPGLAALGADTLDADKDWLAASLAATPIPDGAYGVIRFVPLYEDGARVTVNEVSLQYDIDGSGALSSSPQYYVGNIEVFQPVVSGYKLADGTQFADPASNRILGTMSMVLVPVIPNDVIPPIFSLVTMDGEGTLTDTAPYNALRIQFTMINFRDAAVAGRVKHQMRFDTVTTQQYEAVVGLRNQ